jgi:HEAT repeat protein
VDDLQFMLNELISGDDARAEAVVPGLAQMGAVVLDPLLAMLDSPGSDQRWWATRVLAALTQPEARDGLRRSLKDRDPAVRQCAALGLRQRPTQSAISALIDALHDPDRLFARLAADALVAIGPVAISSLISVMESPDPAARIEAIRALAAIEDPQAIHPLYAALDDPSQMVGDWAEQGLNRLGVGMVYFKP